MPVPDQVSVAGFDDIEMAAMASPPLTTVSIPAAEAGRTAVDLALEALGEPVAERRGSHTLGTALRVRRSTGLALERRDS